MRGRRRIVLIAVAALLFLAISIALARWLSVENVERSDVLAALVSEARGDAAGMLAQLHDCAGRCRAVVTANARALKRPGQVLILAYQSATAYALSSETGDTRVAWKAGNRLPVVQCVRVSRTGNALSGLTVRLLAVGPEIPSTNDCPG